MNYNIRKGDLKQYGVLFMLLFFLVINIFSDYKYRELCMIISFISSVVLIYKSRKEVGSTFVFLFLLLSLIQIAPEYLFEVRTTAYSYFYELDIYNISVTILMVFITTVAIFYEERKTKIINESLSGNNNLIFIILYMVCIYILIFGINRGSYSRYTISIKTIYEYFVMVYCFAYYYSRKNKITNLLLLIIAFIYVIQDFYYGGRVSSVQLIILVSILYFNKLKFKDIMLFSILGYILMNFVEAYRINYTTSGISIANIIKSLITSPVAEYKWNTFSEVLYSSSGLIYTKIHVFSPMETIRSFFDFIINIFMGGEREFGNIVSYISKNVSKVGGGGFLPIYFYFWLGWGGVFLISWITVKLLNFKTNKYSKDYHKLAYILVLATFPRWYLYTPLILFRYVIFNYSIFYIILKVVDRLTKRKMVTNQL